MADIKTIGLNTYESVIVYLANYVCMWTEKRFISNLFTDYFVLLPHSGKDISDLKDCDLSIDDMIICFKKVSYNELIYFINNCLTMQKHYKEYNKIMDLKMCKQTINQLIVSDKLNKLEEKLNVVDDMMNLFKDYQNIN